MVNRSSGNLLIADCPRCGTAKVSFDICEGTYLANYSDGYVLFCQCRQCYEPTNFEFVGSGYPKLVDLQKGSYVNLVLQSLEVQPPAFKGMQECPEFVPEDIKVVFEEATRCLAISCWNAAGTMFRKVIDMTTREMVPDPVKASLGEATSISFKTFKDLRLRLDWLIKNAILAKSLEPLIDCVREDGNDAAHAIDAIDYPTCLDLLDFSVTVLNSVYTEPGKIARNIERRASRRGNA